MDKIWYRNPSKSQVNGRCGGDEKTNDHAEPAKVERQKKIKLKKNKKKLLCRPFWVSPEVGETRETNYL